MSDHFLFVSLVRLLGFVGGSVSPFAAAMVVKANPDNFRRCIVQELWRQNFMWPQLLRRQTAEFAQFCIELVASSLVGVVGLNFWISWSCWCWSRFVVNSVQVSLHPRGVRAKEGCSTEQSALVSVLKFSRVQSLRVSPSCAVS